MQEGRPRINTARTSVPDLCDCFAYTTDEALKDCPTANAEERRLFRYRNRCSEPSIKPQRAALLNYKMGPSEKTLTELAGARGKVERIACNVSAVTGWTFMHSIYLSSERDNIRAM